MPATNLKYKDELPLKTINKIRSILGELGLLTVETAWKNSVRGFYSVSVVIENTDLTTNGKGTTPEFALASAYGELMERLQNQATYRLSLDLKKETLEYQGFYYAPDEKKLSINDLLDNGEEWINNQFARLKPGQDRRELLKTWQGMSYEDIPADFIALPYCNLNTKNISYIPIKMVSKMYMSNGMCAGNTTEEALVQGLSEVMERYANKRVVKDGVVPPTVPRQFLDKFPVIKTMIADIEASGEFEVIVKDCSMGQRLPVVGVVFVNKGDQSYFVKFGAHPKFEIAAERTLTELLQGQDIRRMMGVREFAYRTQADGDQNYMGILVTGSGVYPTAFFGRQSSYPFSVWKDVRAASNREMLVHLVALLRDLGYDTYVRDVSYLGFPGFHVIVPGLSEIEEIDDMRSITDYVNYNRFKRLIRESGSLDADRANTLQELLAKMNFSDDMSLLDLIQLPFRGNLFPWYYSNMNLFRAALNYWKGAADNACGYFDKLLAAAGSQPMPPPVRTYYKCVRDYLGARADGLSEREFAELAGVFYPSEVVKGVLSEFHFPGTILNYQGQLDCWNCQACPFSGQCLYPPMEAVYKILKARYAANPIDQEKLKNLL